MTEAGRRIVFTSFPGVQSPASRTWRASIRRLLASRDEDVLDLADPDKFDTPEDQRRAKANRNGIVVIWRVLSSRNYELAVSTEYFDDLGAARENASWVVAHADDLTTTKVTGIHGFHFAWYRGLIGSPALAARRWYPSYQGRNQSCTLIEATLRDTLVTEVLDERIDGYSVRSLGHPPPQESTWQAWPNRPLAERPQPRPIRGVLSRKWSDPR